jgi:hypothetical protein
MDASDLTTGRLLYILQSTPHSIIELQEINFPVLVSIADPSVEADNASLGRTAGLTSRPTRAGGGRLGYS